MYSLKIRMHIRSYFEGTYKKKKRRQDLEKKEKIYKLLKLGLEIVAVCIEW